MLNDKMKMLLAVVVVTAISNGGQFAAWHFHEIALKESYDKKLAVANRTLDEIGPLIDCYTVAGDVTAGGMVKSTNDLVPLPFPQNYTNEKYILDPNKAVGKYYKINLHPGTALTEDLLMSDQVDDSTRELDLAISSWPTGLQVGDYIDVRIIYPKGEDYIVLSHKRVDAINGSTVKTKLSEREIHFYGAALIDNFVNAGAGSTMYLTKYTDPGIQKPAIVTYNVPNNILTVITANPNIIDKVIDGSISRDIIESQFSGISDNLGGTLNSGRQQHQAKLDQAKEFYNSKLEQNGGTDPNYQEVPTESANDKAAKKDASGPEANLQTDIVGNKTATDKASSSKEAGTTAAKK